MAPPPGTLPDTGTLVYGAVFSLKDVGITLALISLCWSWSRGLSLRAAERPPAAAEIEFSGIETVDSEEAGTTLTEVRVELEEVAVEVAMPAVLV